MAVGVLEKIGLLLRNIQCCQGVLCLAGCSCLSAMIQVSVVGETETGHSFSVI